MCDMTQVREPQVIKKILPVPHQKVTPTTELKQTLLPAMPNWEIKNTTECTAVVCFPELSRSKPYITLPVTMLVRFKNISLIINHCALQAQRTFLFWKHVKTWRHASPKSEAFSSRHISFPCTILKAIQLQGICLINPCAVEFCPWINFTATNKT